MPCKITTAALALLALSACAPVPVDPASRAATCVEAFRNYDLALLLEPDLPGLIGGPLLEAPAGVPGRRAAEAALHQYGCITFPRDLTGAVAEDLADLARPRGGTAVARQYLHLGVVVSNAMEADLRREIEALGYPVRVKGEERLGRRMFIGPLATAQSVSRAGALGAALGFDAIYTLTRIP